MEEEKSTPTPSDKDAGGNEDDFDLKSTDDHSQDDADKDAAEKQADDTSKKGDDDQPSKTDDDKSDDDKKSDDDAADKDAPASKFDDDLDEWANKRGYGKLETDLERRLAQDARNNQREFTRTKQADKVKSEVDKAIRDTKPDKSTKDDDEEELDPAEKRANEAIALAQEERNLRLRSEFFTENSVSEEQSNAMGEILKEKVDKAPDHKKEEVYDYWTDPENLADWHALAKARTADTADTSAIEAKAALNERERIAKEHQANGPARSASSVSTGTKTEEERRLDNFSNWD